MKILTIFPRKILSEMYAFISLVTTLRHHKNIYAEILLEKTTKVLQILEMKVSW